MEHPHALTSIDNIAFTWNGQVNRVEVLRLKEEYVRMRPCFIREGVEEEAQIRTVPG